MGAALIACLAALGCEKGTSGPACSATADEVTRWLRTLNLEGTLFSVDQIRLVRRDDVPTKPLTLAPVVYISATDITFQGQRADPDHGLEELFITSQRKIVEDLQRGDFPDIEPRKLWLLVDERAPWNQVVTTVEAAQRAGFTLPSFIFRPAPGPDLRPPRSWFDDRMDALDAAFAESRVLPPAEPRPIIDNCPAMVRAFGQIGTMETGDKAERLVSLVGPALVECNCQVDLPAFRSQLWHLLHNRDPMRELVIESDADAPPIALPANLPWSEASTRLTSATKRARLTIEN